MRCSARMWMDAPQVKNAGDGWMGDGSWLHRLMLSVNTLQVRKRSVRDGASHVERVEPVSGSALAGNQEGLQNQRTLPPSSPPRPDRVLATRD